MRCLRFLSLALLMAGAATIVEAQEKEQPPPRFGINADLDNYPQDTPKAALNSLLRAYDKGRLEYGVAHVIEPGFVDERLKVAALTFADFVREVSRKFTDDPESLKELRRFAREGEFQVAGETASAKLKEVKDRQVFFKQVGTRWFLENRREPGDAPPAKEEK